MQTTTLLYIVIALLISVAVSFFQYFYKVKKAQKVNILLFVLKTFALFTLSLLLINPKIDTNKTENIKPVLSVLVDNSKSTKHFNQVEKVGEWLQQLKSNKEFSKKFDLKYFSFGSTTNVLDSLTFDESQTNISQSISSINSIYKDNLGAILLLSDGNQTIGDDYEFVNSKQAIFPVVLGDTIQYKDVRISQLNVNKYSYVKNKFPVETILYYEGNEPVTTQFSIFSGGKTIFTQKVSFSSENKTQTIIANLKSAKEGLQYYTASVRKLTGEKNTKNNTKNFSIEVIDQQTKVLILASVLHPDLGALKKAIESNKQRKVDVSVVSNFKNQINDYQLVIFYQPSNNFNKYFQQIKSNYLVISGTKTDWSFLNNQQLGFSKKAINQSENYGAIYNDKFLTFLQKNINFGKFSPLKDKFGEATLSKENQILLKQRIAGVVTEQPLLATFETSDTKSAVLFGEGIWKWRSASFRQTNSFKDFDEFIGNLTQYLASNKKRNRLEVNAESLYPANSTINISAFYTDKNYKFDDRASLQLTLTNSETKEQKLLPFSLVNNSYQVNLEGLSASNYTYKVSIANQNITKYGRFKVTDYNIEEQFTNANHKKLQKLALKTSGKQFYSNQFGELNQELINSKNYYTTQKSTKTTQNLIDWQWILFLAVALLALEWFIRKYYGKI